MKKIFWDLLNSIPDYKEFLTLDEMNESSRKLALKYPDCVTEFELGKSSEGRSIKCLRIGEGSKNSLIFGCPHPNEPIGTMLLEHFTEELAKSEELRKELDYTFYIVKVWDVDGFVRNEGWLKGPYTLYNYSRNFYRPVAYKQVDWTFPVDYKELHFHDTIPETAAMQKLIDAEAEQKSSVQKADAIKTLAEAKASEFAATGIAEAQVMEAKAAATEKQGDADAHIIEAKAEAEAKGIELKGLANAQTELKIGLAKVDVEKNKGFVEAEIIEAKAKSVETKGLAEAKVDSEKYKAEAQGILEKAEAMKKLDGVGKEHEEFKLELEKQKEIDLAQINIQKDIASAQADVLAEALKSANIDIVGGEQEFFDRITGSITKGKTLERTISSSDTLSKVKAQLLDNVEGKTFIDKIKTLIADSNLKSEDIKNVTISALLAKMMASSKDNKQKGLIEHVMYLVKEFGLDNLSTDSLDM